MKSYRSFTGAKGGLTILPTLEERSLEGPTAGTALDTSSERSTNSSLSVDEHQGSNSYPASNLLDMSWGSYLNSGPPTRTGGQLRMSPTEQASQGRGQLVDEASKPADSTPLVDKNCRQKSKVEPHPLLQHLEGLMTALTRSKQELAKCGLDVTPLTRLCHASLSSHDDLKQIMEALGRGGVGCNHEVITSDLVHNLVEFLREVLQGLVSQGKKLNVQAAFLQQVAKQVGNKQHECLEEERKSQERIDNQRITLNAERRELERQGQSIHEAQEELRRVIEGAEENLVCKRKRKGRMDSPHSVAQGRTQLAALIQTQKQQSSLEKVLTQQQRDIRHLQEAHNFTKSELLAIQDHSINLQRKLARKMNEVKVSESTLGSQLRVTRESLACPSMALDKEKRMSYQGTSTAQVKATLKGIAAAQKTLSTEIGRMQRQFSEQHTAERRISRQMEESGERLLEVDSRVKHHTATIKGGHRRTTLQQHEEQKQEVTVALTGGKHVASTKKRTSTNTLLLEQREELTLPPIAQVSENHQVKTTRSKSVLLPKLERSYRAKIDRKSKRHNRLPSYQFSKAELFTLARFDNYEAAQQVMQWLQSQGKMK